MGTVVVEPTDTPYVALSEAVTWIAFQHALGDAKLRAAVIGEPVIDNRTNDERMRDFVANKAEPEPYAAHGFDHFHDREAGLEKIAQAMTVIRHRVEGGGWELRGRYTPKYSVNEAQLAVPEALTGSRLAAFSQFDIETGGLRRQPSGSPSVIWRGHQLVEDREWLSFTGPTGARDGYLGVEVRRDDVMGAFAPTPSPRLTYEQVIEWCRDWIAEGNGTGMDGAWIAFHADPAHAGFSRDDVFRPAWKEAKLK
jgi:hypothetical protein